MSSGGLGGEYPHPSSLMIWWANGDRQRLSALLASHPAVRLLALDAAVAVAATRLPEPFHAELTLVLGKQATTSAPLAHGRQTRRKGSRRKRR